MWPHPPHRLGSSPPWSLCTVRAHSVLSSGGRVQPSLSFRPPSWNASHPCPLPFLRVVRPLARLFGAEPLPPPFLLYFSSSPSCHLTVFYLCKFQKGRVAGWCVSKNRTNRYSPISLGPEPDTGRGRDSGAARSTLCSAGPRADPSHRWGLAPMQHARFPAIPDTLLLLKGAQEGGLAISSEEYPA